MLECINVTKQYRGLTAVNNVSVTLQDNGIYALLGANGSGKTTLMKMISGLVSPTSGAITLNGNPIGVESKNHIAYMPTENYFYNYMTAKDVGSYYADFFQDFSIDKYYAFLNDMQLSPKTQASKMSSGMLAKLKLAATLSRSCQVVLLDEPLNGIDIIARERIIQTILANRGNGRIFILSSHLVDELETIVNGAIFIKDGFLIAYGTTEQLRAYTGMSLVDQYKQIYAY